MKEVKRDEMKIGKFYRIVNDSPEDKGDIYLKNLGRGGHTMRQVIDVFIYKSNFKHYGKDKLLREDIFAFLDNDKVYEITEDELFVGMI